MLEIIGIVALCITNSNHAKARGKDSGGAVMYTIGLWIGGEIAGAFIGMIVYDLSGESAFILLSYVFALCGAIGGGIWSNIIAKRGEVLPAPPGNLELNESEALRKSETMELPCLITITSTDEEPAPYYYYIYLNGFLIGYLQREPGFPAVSSISVQTTSLLNIITIGSRREARLPWPASFNAIPGGRVDLFFKQGSYVAGLTQKYTLEMLAPVEQGIIEQ
ncbi:MAG: hypothetical protein FWH40_07095 [Coriobacteriia bacterium]|nr:hypothetical protein [Coriobacteriia bacterium]